MVGILSAVVSSTLAITLVDRIGSMIVSSSGEDIAELSFKVATSDMLIVFGVGLAIICLAVVIASYTVIRLKPRDILTKMS